MYRSYLGLAVVLAAMAWGAAPAHGQTVTTEVSYAAGYNMVGGPDGTNFDLAASLFSFDGTSYTALDTRTTSACVGYWAYYRQSTIQELSSSATGPSQSCPLRPGYTMVGNPFSGRAQLPAGTTAYLWNASLQQYVLVTAIPTGGAVWIYSTGGGSVTLTYVPDVPPLSHTLTISSSFGAARYAVHVGDTVKLQIPLSTLSRAQTDPTLLRLDASGELGPLSCINGNQCAFTFTTQFFTWKAIGAGTAFIDITPICTSGVPCAAPLRIEVDIS